LAEKLSTAKVAKKIRKVLKVDMPVSLCELCGFSLRPLQLKVFGVHDF